MKELFEFPRFRINDDVLYNGERFTVRGVTKIKEKKKLKTLYVIHNGQKYLSVHETELRMAFKRSAQ